MIWIYATIDELQMSIMSITNPQADSHFRFTISLILVSKSNILQKKKLTPKEMNRKKP